MDNTIKVKIIRHSERFDISNPISWGLWVCLGQYWADSPLTNAGYIMASEKGKKLASVNFNPKYIYTSPYKRTMATATEIQSSFQQSKIVIEPLLSEYQPNRKHRIDLYPNGIPTEYEGEYTGFQFPETYENFTKRVHFIISKLIEKNNHDILMVSHGEILKVFVTYLQEKYPEKMLDPGSTPYLTTLSFSYDKKNKKIMEDSIELS